MIIHSWLYSIMSPLPNLLFANVADTQQDYNQNNHWWLLDVVHGHNIIQRARLRHTLSQ